MANTATAPREQKQSPPAQRNAAVGRLGVVSITLGLFAIVTTEILPIGLLLPIGETFRVTDGTTGITMAIPGIIAAIAAPTVTLTTARLDRRIMLIALTFLLLLSNLLFAVAPEFWLVLVSRVLLGVVIGGFWSIGSGLATRLVPQRSVASATALIFSAVPLGSVLGVPSGTFVGRLTGWRTAFVLLAVLSAICLALLALLPRLPAKQVTRLDVLRSLLGRRATRIALLTTFFIVLAHFGTYTYVTPFLQDVAHVNSSLISVLLLVYGAAGILGNFAAGWGLARNVRATSIAVTGSLATATLLLPFFGRTTIGAVALLVLWGFAYGAVPACSQAWFARSAPDAQEASSVLFTASFQATFALGAFAGGIVVDASSTSIAMLAGGLVATLAALTLGVSGRSSD